MIKLGDMIIDEKMKYYQFFCPNFDSDMRASLSIPVPTEQVELLKSATTFDCDLPTLKYAKFTDLKFVRSEEYNNRIMGKQGKVSGITVMYFKGRAELIKPKSTTIFYSTVKSTDRNITYRIEAKKALGGICENLFVEYTKENLPPQITKESIRG